MVLKVLEVPLEVLLEVLCPGKALRGDILSAQDEYGFTALPAGERGFRGFFSGAENYGSGKWWTASTIEYAETRQNEIRYRYLDFRDSELHQASAMKTRGLSVRCVKD